MITPNKVVTLKESALGHFHVIMGQGPGPVSVLTLYHAVKDHFESIDDFILTMDALYVLGRIEIDTATRLVTYAN